MWLHSAWHVGTQDLRVELPEPCTQILHDRHASWRRRDTRRMPLRSSPPKPNRDASRPTNGRTGTRAERPTPLRLNRSGIDGKTPWVCYIVRASHSPCHTQSSQPASQPTHVHTPPHAEKVVHSAQYTATSTERYTPWTAWLVRSASRLPRSLLQPASSKPIHLLDRING